MAFLAALLIPCVGLAQTSKKTEKATNTEAKNNNTKQQEVIYTEPSGIYKSTDGATTWNVVYSKKEADRLALEKAKSDRIYSVVFTAGDKSYRSDDGGQSWKTESAAPARKGATAQSQKQSKTSLAFFPQPVGNDGKARLTLENAADVALVIYDTHGHAVAQPIDSYMSEGEFTLPLDFSMLASGSYTYTLTVGGSVQSGSLVIVK